MDAFRLRETVVADYAEYVQSFLAILDPRIRAFVDEQLADGMLWPDPLLQLSPTYQPAETVAELADLGVLHQVGGQLFQVGGRSLRLHQHQRTAIDLAAHGLNYVVTTGTGSGKSLTYLLPIVDHVLRSTPEVGGVRAIIVYPMNALINSQEQALARFAENLGGRDACPVRFARYTGQESEAEMRELRERPPHLVLTNYVMLELMLTRPEERVFFARTGTLQFLVLDELHTYRGRQGADVALLVRRLRERSGNPQIQCVGTSATMAIGATRRERNTAVADVASTLFGAPLTADQVIDEALRWSFARPTPPTVAELRTALTGPLPQDWGQFAHNPLAAWVEDRSEGRSTATTLLTLSTITQMHTDPALKDDARKLLSFTDNRQDASLQAGHFNDFVSTALLRAAIYRAVATAPEGLDYTRIAREAVSQLGLSDDAIARELRHSPQQIGQDSVNLFHPRHPRSIWCGGVCT